jgi:molybdopterin-biosynthesis enzyme MoeA-like protein
MKDKIIKFFQNLPVDKYEQFNTAFQLYRNSEGKNIAVERSLNATGFSESSLANLLYDLQKMHGITDAEKIAVPKVDKKELPDERIAILAVVVALQPEEYNAWNEALKDTKYNTENLIQFAVSVGNDKAVEVLKAIALASLEVTNSKTLSSDQVLGDGNIEGVQGNRPDNSEPGIPINELAEITGTSIRDEFPYLNDKECPNELKILVADKISAFKRYEAYHADLLKIESGELEVSPEEQAEIAENTKLAFEENQAIYNELNAFKETGKLLGKHPIFKTLQFQREVDEMTSEQLNKYIGSSAKYFSDNKKSLLKAEKENDETKIVEINERVADREIKLAMVNKKLGIPIK